jgi:excisionase family DNA binding protein
MNEILTVPEIADHLKVNEKTVYRLLNTSTIRGFKVGNQWRVLKDDLLKFINRSMNKVDGE